MVATAPGGTVNHSLSGSEGDDSLYGGDGADTLTGIEGVNGSAFSDTLTAGTGGSSLNGNDGADILFGGAGSDTMQGGTGSDSLYAAGSGDLMYGGSGVDYFYGGGGNDSLSGGGGGNDALTGGSGDDALTFATASGQDIIRDFDLGDADQNGFTNDRLDVSALTDLDGNPVTSYDVTISDDGQGNAVLTFPGGEQITIVGPSPRQRPRRGCCIRWASPVSPPARGSSPRRESARSSRSVPATAW